MVHGHIALGGGLKFISSHPGTSLKDLSLSVYQQQESVQTSWRVKSSVKVINLKPSSSLLLTIIIIIVIVTIIIIFIYKFYCIGCCFVEIVTTSQSINELNYYFPNCDTLQARQPFGNYSVLLYLYFTVITFLIRLLCVTYRFRTTLTKNKQQFETHGFGCVSQQNSCY